VCNSKERSVGIVGKCVSKKIENKVPCQRSKQSKLGLEEKYLSKDSNPL